MHFIFPVQTKPISLTGGVCKLDCAHCNRHYLKQMATSEQIAAWKERGDKISSILVSGGCDENGMVPLLDYKPVLKSIKKDYRLVAHTGLFNPSLASELKGLIDVASFDFPAGTKAIKEVFGLERVQSDYVESIRALAKYVPTVPHLTIGIHKGNISGEKIALEKLESLGFRKVILNVFIPAPGTRLAGTPPTPIEQVAPILEYAYNLFRRTYLGCMRPAGEYRRRLDLAALPLVSGIVMPDKEAIKRAPDAKRFYECCAFDIPGA